MNAEQAAMKVLNENAQSDVVKAAADAVEGGTHRWAWDPQNSSVIGLLRVGTNTADVLIWLASPVGAACDDFELCDDFDAALV